jgi:hypothetical protein
MYWTVETHPGGSEDAMLFQVAVGSGLNRPGIAATARDAQTPRRIPQNLRKGRLLSF